jgi:hypothetical protein
MSAVRSLSGVNRTWRGHRQTDANDPSTKSLRDSGDSGLVLSAVRKGEIVGSGGKRPVLRIEVSSTSSMTGVAYDNHGYHPAASKIARLIMSLIESEPNGAWLLSDICRRAYPDIKRVEKKHRVAVARTLRTMKLPGHVAHPHGQE